MAQPNHKKLSHPESSPPKVRGPRYSFGALAEALEETRTRLAELEAREARRLQQLAEYVGMRLLAEAREPSTRVAAVDWLKRQQNPEFSSTAEREILEDFLASIDNQGEAHGH